MDETPFDSKNTNLIISSKNYTQNLIKDSKPNDFQNEEINFESNNYDSIVQNENEENIDDSNNDKSLYKNEKKQYSILFAKYKRLQDKNKKLNEEIKKDELIIEEQKSYILLLKASIENDFFKNNDIKKYITTENIIDFIKLQSEKEQYKKELVLSQALVNSLQAENMRLTQSREDNSDFINLETEDFLSNSENKISNTNMNTSRQGDVINELNKENNILKKLVQEATIKLNNLLINEKNEKILIDKNNVLSYQINEKNDIINNFEEKISFFNNYITSVKNSFNQIKNYLINNINSYNKIANEDLNSLLSNTFSQNIMKLSMKLSNTDDIEEYNLDIGPEIDLHNILSEFFSCIKDEFFILYEKVFQTNNYYKELNEKNNELENQLRELSNNIMENNEVVKLKDDYVKTIIKLNLELSEKECDNYNLKDNINYLKNDINDMIYMISLLINAISNTNEKNLINYLNNYLKNIREKNSIITEKEETIKNMMKNNRRFKNLKLENKNVENLQFFSDEYINNTINSFENKIIEKEKLINLSKEKISSLLI